MKHEQLRSISLKGVAAGFLSLVVGTIAIALFGYKYRVVDWPGGGRNQIAGVTPMFWVGITIIAFGIACVVGGMTLFVLSKPNQMDNL